MLVAITVAAAIQTAKALSRSDILAALVAGGWLLLTVSALASIAVGRLRSGGLSGVVERSGVTFRPDLHAWWLVACSFLGGATASGLTLLFRDRDGGALPFSSIDRANEALYMFALFILTAVGLGVFLVRGRGHLKLTPQGIENSELFSVHTADWEDVTAITDTAPYKPRRDPISFFVKDREKPIVINNASGYATNGAALYWMVRHYWLHPERRGELADGRALDRLRSEDFVPE